MPQRTCSPSAQKSFWVSWAAAKMKNSSLWRRVWPVCSHTKTSTVKIHHDKLCQSSKNLHVLSLSTCFTFCFTMSYRASHTSEHMLEVQPRQTITWTINVKLIKLLIKNISLPKEENMSFHKLVSLPSIWILESEFFIFFPLLNFLFRMS